MAGNVTFDILARDRASRVFDKVGNSASRSQSKMSRFGAGLAKAGKAAAIGLGVAAVAGVAVGKKLVDAGERASTANARIAQVADSMGLFGKQSGEVAERISKLAESTARNTGVDQNAIKVTAAKLLTFKALGKTADEVGGNFDRATKAAVDLASAGFGSAESNATQLGKALQDPVKGLSALGRAGVTFTDGEKKRIATLVESNKVGKAQELVLKAIESQVGGVSEATANSTAKIKVAFSQVAESLGQKLLPFVARAADGIASFIGQMQSGQGAGGRFANVMRRIGEAAQQAGSFIGREIIPRLQALAAFVRTQVNPALAAFGRTVLPAAQESLKSISRSVSSLTRDLNLGASSGRGFGSALVKAITYAGPVVAAELRVIALNVRILAAGFRAATTAPRLLARAVVAAVTQIKNVLDGSGGIGFEFGRNLVLGMIRGIGSLAGAAASAAANVARGALNAAKGLLQIKSPSKVMIRVGGQFTEGFAEGIRDKTKDAVAAVKEMVSKVAGKLGDLKSQAADIAKSVGDSVRGVLDVGSLGVSTTTQDENGNDVTSTPNIREQITAAAAAAAEFSKAISAATATGVNGGLIQQLVSASNVAGLQALGALSKGDVKSVNSSIGQIDRFAGNGADAVLKTTPLPEQIKREQESLAELRQIKQAIREGTVAEVKLKGDDLVVVIERAQKKNRRR